MQEKKQKRATVAILGLLIAFALFAATCLDICFLKNWSGAWAVWIGMAAVAAASLAINMASVAKRNRAEENNIATISKPVAICIVTMAFVWLLTFILSLIKL